MTRYELMTKKIDTLKSVGFRCSERGSRFTEVWFGKAYELKEKRDSLTIEQAGEKI